MFNQHNVFLQAIARMHENVNEDWECCFTVQISNFIFQKVFLERKMMFVLFTFFLLIFCLIKCGENGPPILIGEPPIVEE